MGSWDRLDIYERDGFHCKYCGFDGTSFEHWPFLVVDHFVPLSKGGRDESDNLVTACRFCNDMKFDRSFSDLEAARSALSQERDKVSLYWKQNVEPRLAKK
jgi:5-methylcytosine-specific restriction endonuclease McrA